MKVYDANHFKLGKEIYVFSKFLWKPLKINGVTRWLEFSDYAVELKAVNHKRKWVPVRWL